MVKIFASLRNFRDRIRAAISLKTRNVLFFTAIFLLVFLAILIRISPIFRGPLLIKAFDPWIQWYNSEYLSTHTLYEYFSWHDYKSWYPTGFYRGSLRPGLTFTVVAIYHIFNFLGLHVSLYHICYFFPAIMGGITVLLTYYLGKEIHDRGTGLIAAFFLAFNPGYMQRTMAGFFDNETIGVFATLLTFLFLLKSLKTGKIIFSILGGLALGYLSLSWGGYQFVYLIIPIFCIILILIDKYNQNILITYAVIEGMGLLVFSLYTGFKVSSLFTDLEIGGIFLFTIILVVFHIIQSKRKDHPNLYKNLINAIKWALIPGILIIAVIIWIAPEIIPFGFGARFQTILNPLFRENISLVASVAEQMPSPWSVFYYNALIPLILAPLGIYFCFKILNAPEIFLILFVLLMFYFTGSMIRIILIFSPAVSLVGAYGLVSILNIFSSFLGERRAGVSRKRKRQVKGTMGNSEILAIFLIVGFLGVAQVVHATDISIEQFSFSQINPAGIVHDWEEALIWMRSNLAGTDVVVSWWDYGYWLTPIGNVTTVNDNATLNHTRIGLTGMALMQTNEIYSAKAFKRLGADYVLVYFGLMISGLGGDEGKWPWMVRICNDNYNIYKNLGMEEDNWADDSVFVEDEYQNSAGRMGEKWFQSQLVRLMFYATPTDQDINDDGTVDQRDQNDVRWTYVTQINSETTQEGNLWKDYIPDDGAYEYDIFVPTYISNWGLVKLFKIDYTVLESNFMIQDGRVFDNGYAVFNIKNTGTKDLLIKNVKINGIAYNFILGENSETNIVENGDTDIVWVDTKSKGTIFQKDDIVDISVTAESEAIGEKKFEFSNSTSNFFVEEAEQGTIKINKKNSRVIQKDALNTDIFLEVENVGNTTEILDRFYLNDDTVENRIDPNNIEYISNSTILKPGEIANLHISNVTTSFYPIKTYNKVGVATPTNAKDEVLFTSTIENYSISVISEERILSPEILASFGSDYRNHIPVILNKTHAYTYDNGSTIIKINVKNTGDIVFGIDSIYLTESLIPVDFEDFNSFIVDENERTIIVDATDYVDHEVNDEILVCVTGSFTGTTVTSDIFYVHTIRDDKDIQIIDDIEGISTSFIYANETGKLLIKNTGDQLITIDEIRVNDTYVSNISYIYGSPSLNLQECAVLTFNIPGLKINKSDDMVVNVTFSSKTISKTLKAYVDPVFYDLRIDEDGTSVYDSANMTLLFTNYGQQNVTLESVYVNETYIPLPYLYAKFDSTWVPLTSDNIEAFEIGIGESMELTISVDTLELPSILGITINPDDELVILIRVEEGAEISHLEIVL